MVKITMGNGLKTEERLKIEGKKVGSDRTKLHLMNAGHASCLKLSPAVIQTVKLSRWQCQDCKTCTVCKASRGSNKHRSAVCCHFY